MASSVDWIDRAQQRGCVDGWLWSVHLDDILTHIRKQFRCPPAEVAHRCSWANLGRDSSRARRVLSTSPIRTTPRGARKSRDGSNVSIQNNGVAGRFVQMRAEHMGCLRDRGDRSAALPKCLGRSIDPSPPAADSHSSAFAAATSERAVDSCRQLPVLARSWMRWAPASEKPRGAIN
jgi:hypothetical protein